MRFLLISALVFVAVFTQGAHAQPRIEFVRAADDKGAVIFAISDENDLSAVENVAGPETAKRIARAVGAKQFVAREGASASFITGERQWGEVHLIGIKKADMRARDWQDFGGRAAVLAKSSAAQTITIIADQASNANLRKAALGTMLGGYAFNTYRSNRAAPSTQKVSFLASNKAQVSGGFSAREDHLGDAIWFARDLQSEPANILYPEEMVRRIRAAFRGVANVSIDVLDERDMARAGMGAILGVGRGSERPPRLVAIRYRGAQGQPIALVGKGVTFDSGGLSLKPNQNLWLQKSDMTGAAVVSATMLSLAKSQAPVHVVAVLPLAENMPDGKAIRPGDVLRTMSGVSVEVRSTDAEGRLLLADAIWYAQTRFEPKLLIDVATLTGAVSVALGDEYAGLFTRDDQLANELLKAGAFTGDDLWRLPLHPNHIGQLASPIADLKNGETGAPGASTAASFVGFFVRPEIPWAHIDIAGVDWMSEPTPTVPVGASGFGVRLLDDYVRRAR